jgi:hypothetical protein
MDDIAVGAPLADGGIRQSGLYLSLKISRK